MTQLIRLTCSSCGATLEIPDKQNVVHCKYCGTKILLAGTELNNDRQKVDSYIDSGKAAVNAQNYIEALDYCKKILDIDSKCVDGWLLKAKATFGLSTETGNKYDEAISYLATAEQIDGHNPQIAETKNDLLKLQSIWFYKLGNDNVQRALQVMKIWNAKFSFSGLVNAQNYSKEFWERAANYYLQALKYSPNDLVILSSLAEVVKKANWIHWSKLIKEQVNSYNQFLKEQKALNKRKSDVTLTPNAVAPKLATVSFSVPAPGHKVRKINFAGLLRVPLVVAVIAWFATIIIGAVIASIFSPKPTDIGTTIINILALIVAIGAFVWRYRENRKKK